MGDSWEDWDDDAVAVPAPAVAIVGQQEEDKFADEDIEEEEPKWKGSVPEPQQAKPKVSKYDESRGLQKVKDEGPLDDPVAEKLRQQRLVEEADYASTMELFGSSRELEGFIPKTNAEFEELGKLIAAKYLLPHANAKPSLYKAALKSLLHTGLSTQSASDVKDIETCVAGIRSEKLKEEKALQAGKKAQKKAALNVGKGGGSAGLDDYVYDDPLEDDFDFM